MRVCAYVRVWSQQDGRRERLLAISDIFASQSRFDLINAKD